MERVRVTYFLPEVMTEKEMEQFLLKTGADIWDSKDDNDRVIDSTKVVDEASFRGYYTESKNDVLTFKMHPELMLINALEILGKSFHYLTRTWDLQENDSIHDILADGYPFEMSFDELSCEVDSWAEEAIDNINGQLKF